MHMPEYPNEGALRGGHIPGAANVPWARAINPDDGTFKTAEQLRAIYEGEAKLQEGDDVVVYCRIGERSSHTWFVLTNLLGYPRVRNYDGSWTEWGNLVGRADREVGRHRDRFAALATDDRHVIARRAATKRSRRSGAHGCLLTPGERLAHLEHP
jgi:rhodanese-related sulfurtransferase